MDRKKAPPRGTLLLARTGVLLEGRRRKPITRTIGGHHGMKRVRVPVEKSPEPKKITLEDLLGDSDLEDEPDKFKESDFEEPELEEPESDFEELESDFEELGPDFEEPDFEESEEGPSRPPVDLQTFEKWEHRRMFEDNFGKKRSLGPEMKIEKDYVDYTEKSEPLPLSERQKAILKKTRIKIPTKTRKMAPTVKARYVRDMEISYDSIFRGQVGPFGIVIPFKSGRTVKPIGDVLPRHRPSTSSPIFLKDPVRSPKLFKRKRVHASEFYNLPVTQEMRDAVAEMFFDIISKKRIPLFTVDLKKKEVTKAPPLIPKLIGSTSDSPKSPLPPKISKKTYTEYTLKNLVRKEIYDKLTEEIPREELEQEAERIIEEKRDVEKILDDLEKRISPNLFKELWKWNADLLWEQLQTSKDDTELELILRMVLQRQTISKRKSIQGKRLQTFISRVISLYRQRLLTTKNRVYKDLEVAWLRKVFDERFNKEKKKLLDKWRNKINEEWEKYSTEYDGKIEEEEKVGKLTTKGKRFYKQIQEMEEGFLAELTSPSIVQYLSKVLYPLLFLDTIGDVGRHAKFFQKKIKVGDIAINELPMANLAHYIPELMMKHIRDETSPILDQCVQRMGLDLKRRIDEFIALFMAHKGINVFFPPALSYFPWKRFLGSPQDVCFKDTGTGYQYSDDGSKEKIPDEELIVCLIKGVGFVCHSIQHIAWAVVRDKGDPMTGKPYSEDLVSRLQRQHPGIFENAKKEYKRALLLEKELFDEEGDDYQEGDPS